MNSSEQPVGRRARPRERTEADRPGTATRDEVAPPTTAPHPGGRPRDPAIEEAILQATRARLASDGYSRTTIGDIVADAGVTRPTLYRRWPGKHELVADAIRYGLRKQREAHPPLDTDAMTPRDAFTEAVRRLDPRHHNPHAMQLHGNFMGEAEREPDLFALIRDEGNRPRCEELLNTLRRLRDRGAVRADVDLDTAVTLCFGCWFGDYLRTGGAAPRDLADRVVALLWPTLTTDPPSTDGGGATPDG